jgi:hypothetical protein
MSVNGFDGTTHKKNKTTLPPTTNPWISWAFGHGMVDSVLSLTDHIQG